MNCAIRARRDVSKPAASSLHGKQKPGGILDFRGEGGVLKQGVLEYIEPSLLFTVEGVEKRGCRVSSKSENANHAAANKLAPSQPPIKTRGLAIMQYFSIKP